MRGKPQLLLPFVVNEQRAWPITER